MKLLRAKIIPGIALLLFVFFFFILSAYALETNLSGQAMNNRLYALETNTAAANPAPVKIETKEELASGGLKGFTQSFKANDGYVDFGLRFGYIYGQNSYDFKHHTSELEFPFRSYMGGGKLDVGYKNFSVNSEFWGSLFDDPSAGWHTKDKDWDDGQLYSDTKSYSDMNAVIWDLNMRYNLFNHAFGKKNNSEGKNPNKIKIGALLGYRYERFGYKDYGLYETSNGSSSYGDGQMVSEYKIKYRLPYYGMAMDISGEKFGVLMSAKYAFSPSARDYDNHTLRALQFHGDYKKNGNVLMANMSTFWNFYKGWKASAGVDATLIRINGVVWSENHDPSWDASQNIDTKQFIYWLGLGYQF